MLILFVLWALLLPAVATAYGRNASVKGYSEKAKFMGLCTSVTKAPTSNTAIAASLINMTGSEAAGWTNGKVVYIRKLTGSVTGLVEARAYFIVGAVTNGFELAEEEGGAAIKVAGHTLETGSTEFDLITEVSGGSYVRIATSWGAAAEGIISDTAKQKFKVPAATTVSYAIHHEKSSAGTNKEIPGVMKATTPETFGAEGEYEATEDKFEAPYSLA